MENLQQAGFGTYKIVNKLKVFYKVLPNNVNLEAKLSTFNIPCEEFKTIFCKVDGRLTSRNTELIMDGHPDAEGLENYLHASL